MKAENATHVTEFFLLGFPTGPRLQLLLFAVFLGAYLLVLVENLLIILAVWASVSLHKPMYYFLASLSFLETWYVTNIVPEMLDNFLLRWQRQAQQQRISFVGCMVQLYIFSSLACSECVLLAAMAYDRHVAIRHPLRYPVLMSPRACGRLVVFSFTSGFAVSAVKVYFIANATFCGSNVLNHFFCDISPILKLACTDFSTAERVDFVLALAVLVLPLAATVLSYGSIASAVVRIPSASGRRKSFSTCASHLSVVTVFYTAIIFMYVRPRAIDSRDSNKLVSAVYTILTPVVNPLIYCLRNKEFKRAVKNSLGRGRRSH
ncbi:olfactory receptor 6B2-like [Ornithorhynchus anatinus]|uniref:olfactory receptor 6B2-like n=1 Tax=Ornithorhynchus anatinus TaxID=9258 RepID=UPI0010A839D3|nr:olfactory receptor 6B2-like [Ornithorhynchus anatinus]